MLLVVVVLLAAVVLVVTGNSRMWAALACGAALVFLGVWGGGGCADIFVCSEFDPVVSDEHKALMTGWAAVEVGIIII